MGIIKQSMPEAVLFAIARSSFHQSSTKNKKKGDWQNINPLYTCNIEKGIFTKIYNLLALGLVYVSVLHFPGNLFFFLALS